MAFIPPPGDIVPNCIPLQRLSVANVVASERVHLRAAHHHGLSLPADGVALGAAASTSQTSVQLIVFVAIMLHKVFFLY